MMTFYIQDTREGIEVYAISCAGLMIHLACSTRIFAYELARLVTEEDVYLEAREEGDDMIPALIDETRRMA